MLYNPTVQEVREFFYHAWHKSRQSVLLAPMEQLAVHWMSQHPEYHAVLNGPIEALIEAQFLPESGQTNPFLHLSMHLSISEQVAANQPTGIRDAFNTLAAKTNEHDAAHVLMEALGQMLWQAQRDQREPDSASYLAHIYQLAELPNPTSKI